MSGPEDTGWLADALSAHWGLRAQTIRQTPGGWSADAYAVHTAQGDYFCKAYDRQKPSVRPWLERMEAYMPAVLWLAAQPMAGHLLAPVLTQGGAYRAETPARTLLLFPYIAGDTLAEAPLRPAQVRQLAETLALLHAHGEDIPCPTGALREDYALPFLPRLDAVLADAGAPAALRRALAPHRDVLQTAANRLRALADGLRATPPPQVLCHTDVHGWNLMWDGARLHLIDWEGLRLAPAEADLFVFTDGYFFADAQAAFLAAYRALRPGYTPHAAAMAFYRLRRRLEDIADFAYSIAYDGLDAQAADRSLWYLDKELRALAEGG